MKPFTPSLAASLLYSAIFIFCYEYIETQGAIYSRPAF